MQQSDLLNSALYRLLKTLDKLDQANEDYKSAAIQIVHLQDRIVGLETKNGEMANEICDLNLKITLLENQVDRFVFGEREKAVTPSSEFQVSHYRGLEGAENAKGRLQTRLQQYIDKEAAETCPVTSGKANEQD